ncbi:class I SAM-dependent DNA methyltransferase [Hanstruepera ponticola]|uniref:class I SAM-dependent DNA methyltransferase n=1 Tax=Hanstruepera ponticola TaxID=2042995 RepID=UPI000CF1102E|nr:class I SAM-dependent methyltransferase [Hanstruepera ponticola]
MDRFNLYAAYYNLLYEDKDYQSEVNYILQLFERHSLSPLKNVLDLGCGTGIHANLLSKLGCNVDGVDASIRMIEQAENTFGNNQLLNFYVDDIIEFKSNKTYDLVTSLFHVISYQNTNIELLKSFKTAYNHLENQGLFIFDFWYGPGVLTERPEMRIKELENNKIVVKRKALPRLFINENVVDVNYEIDILDKNSGSSESIKEKHSMRYFFIKELAFYLESSGFKMADFFEWMTFDKPNDSCWNAVVIAKKI